MVYCVLSTLGRTIPNGLLTSALRCRNVTGYFRIGSSVTRLIGGNRLGIIGRGRSACVVAGDNGCITRALGAALSLAIGRHTCSTTCGVLMHFGGTGRASVGVSHRNSHAFVAYATVSNRTPFVDIGLLIYSRSRTLRVGRGFLRGPSRVFSGLVSLLSRWRGADGSLSFHLLGYLFSFFRFLGLVMLRGVKIYFFGLLWCRTFRWWL